MLGVFLFFPILLYVFLLCICQVSRGRAIMEHLLEDSGASCNIPKERVIEELLMDDMKANAAYLPNTGQTMEWEHKLSSICVDTIGTMVLKPNLKIFTNLDIVLFSCLFSRLVKILSISKEA